MTGSNDEKPSNPGAIPISAPTPSLTIKTVITPQQASGPSRGIFVVIKGSDAGRVMSLMPGQVITLGRAEECTYRFDETSLSRIHARVMCIGGQYVISDLTSTNGSFVNDQRIDKPQVMRSGDRVQLGTGVTLNFLLVEEAEEASMRRLYEAALRDGLTGVFNRKHLEERLDAEIAFAIRHNTPLSLIILDVDFFKKVNDTYGHPAGDAVLRHLGALLQQSLRTEDMVARYGGEEFVIVLRGIDRNGALQLGERLRATLASQTIHHASAELRVTLSAGVASLDECAPQRTKATLLSLADGRLYQAKQGGRNRVV